MLPRPCSLHGGGPRPPQFGKGLSPLTRVQITRSQVTSDLPCFHAISQSSQAGPLHLATDQPPPSTPSSKPRLSVIWTGTRPPRLVSLFLVLTPCLWRCYLRTENSVVISEHFTHLPHRGDAWPRRVSPGEAYPLHSGCAHPGIPPNVGNSTAFLWCGGLCLRFTLKIYR